MTHTVNEYDEKNVSILEVQCLGESAKAILVAVNGDEHWIPKTQVHDDSDVFAKGHTGKLVISKWIAIQRELWEE